MSKRTTFSTVTPLPAGLSRDAVLETLHSHYEMIDLNPLVIDRFKCDAPSHCSEEERSCKWYTIKDKIDYLPGGLASGNIAYNASFHDLPDGLQTHTFAPMGVEIRGRWTLGGTLPGEPKQTYELGAGVPREGLWLKEDVDLRCNVLMAGFVKKNMQKSHGTLVEKLFEKIKRRQEDKQMGSVVNGAPAQQASPPLGSLHSVNSQGSGQSSSSMGPQGGAGYYAPEGMKVNHLQKPRLYGHDLPGPNAQTPPNAYRTPSPGVQGQAGPLPPKGYAPPHTSAYSQQATAQQPGYNAPPPNQLPAQQMPPTAYYAQGQIQPGHPQYSQTPPPAQHPQAYDQPPRGNTYPPLQQSQQQHQPQIQQQHNSTPPRAGYNGNTMQGYQLPSQAQANRPAPQGQFRAEMEG